MTGQGEMYAEGSNAHDGSTPNQDKELEEEARRDLSPIFSTKMVWKMGITTYVRDPYFP